MLKCLFRNKFRIDEGISESIFSLSSVSQTARRRIGMQDSLRSPFGLLSLASNGPRPSVPIWNTIHLQEGAIHDFQLATLCFERSKDAPLNIIISTLFQENRFPIFSHHIRLESRVCQYVFRSGARRKSFHAESLEVQGSMAFDRLLGLCQHTLSFFYVLQ